MSIYIVKIVSAVSAATGLFFGECGAIGKNSTPDSSGLSAQDRTFESRFKSPLRKAKSTPFDFSQMIEYLAMLRIASHCWRYRIILRKKDFARILRRLPLARLPSSSAGGGRLTPSRASVARVQIFPAKAKSTPFGVLCFGGEGEI